MALNQVIQYDPGVRNRFIIGSGENKEPLVSGNHRLLGEFVLLALLVFFSNDTQEMNCMLDLDNTSTCSFPMEWQSGEPMFTHHKCIVTNGYERVCSNGNVQTLLGHSFANQQRAR